MDDGTWRITGKKWFYSNINAEQFLITGRLMALAIKACSAVTSAGVVKQN